jgi:hypothetical protein
MTKKLLFLVAALVAYSGFSLYLYHPHFDRFDVLDYLYPVSSILAALGCLVLSRRWVGSFIASFFAGAVYGFGPFLLGFARFHPTGALLPASIPWLLLPAAYMAKNKWRALVIPLSLLPFLAIILFFELSIRHRLFAVSTQAKLQPVDLTALLAPLVMVGRSSTLISFYHVPSAALVIGILMLFAARRVGIIALLVVPILLSFCDSVNASLNVSPIAWLTVPVVCCSILVGLGTQGLVSAASADRRYILFDTILMGTLAIVSLLLATKYFQFFGSLADGAARLFLRTALMYVLAAIAAAIIFLMARTKLRLRPLRLILLGSAMVADIILGATIIVDRMF